MAILVVGECIWMLLFIVTDNTSHYWSWVREGWGDVLADNWECTYWDTGSNESMYTVCMCTCAKGLAEHLQQTLADHGNTKIGYSMHVLIVVWRQWSDESLKFEWGERERKRASYCQPFSLTMCASSMINFPSLYFWLASNACSYSNTKPHKTHYRIFLCEG